MPFTILSKTAETRAHLQQRRASRKGPVILVPTMGALHDGHAELIRLARRRAGDEGTVVVSAFVNPAQFAPDEDLDSYPRSPERDRQVCEACQADLLFAPDAAEMYAPDHSTDVFERRLSIGLCGASRPRHFPGVSLVVVKLFGIVQPTHAVFGKKDYQQLAVIRRLVRDLNIPVEIIGAETVREESGLAMSSRNEKLSEAERRAASGIRAALIAGKEQWEKMPDLAPSVLVRLVRSRLERVPGGQIDYVELVDAETLETARNCQRPMVMAAAMSFRQARLIDNIEFGPEHPEG